MCDYECVLCVDECVCVLCDYECVLFVDKCVLCEDVFSCCECVYCMCAVWG